MLEGGLLAHSEGLSWIDAAKVANLIPHAMRQWRKHPDAENFINHAINSSLEESLGQLAQATPALANRLIKIALDDKTRGYTCVSAIQTAFSILQSGVIDRENKSELVLPVTSSFASGELVPIPTFCVEPCILITS